MTTETNDRGESRFDGDMSGHAADAHSDHGHDTLFASAHHEERQDYIFQSQGENAAAGQPEQVQVKPGDHVIRVNVTPGEILELAPPFTPDALLLGREAHGNLAIKVGDVTVILEGYIDANSKTPVTVETSDGKPIDIAVLLASTDPNVNIQTAAGPGTGGEHAGQGAGNTGGIFSEFGGGNGLGGFGAVGVQDLTSLQYGLIDANFRQEITTPTAVTPAEASFVGLQEPFLIDPPHHFLFSSGNGSHDVNSFSDFESKYLETDDSSEPSDDPNNTGADFDGTAITRPLTPAELQAALAKTSETITISHSSTDPERLTFDSNFFNGLTIPTSNGIPLTVKVVDNGETAFLVRHDGPGQNTIVMVFHILNDDTGTTGDYQVQAFLVDRLDEAPPSDPNASEQNVLTIDFNTTLLTPPPEGQEGETTQHQGPQGSVDVLDDVPIAGTVEYLNQGHGFPSTGPTTESLTEDSKSDGEGHGHDYTPTFISENLGYIDEDWIKGGNQDKDNTPPGSSSDPSNGDQPGHASLAGYLNINFGADGPFEKNHNSGGGNDGGHGNDGGGGNDTSSLFVPSHAPLLSDSSQGVALTLDGNYAKGDPIFDSATHQQLTSDGIPLVVLDSYTDSKGIEHLCVGYNTSDTTGESGPTPDTFFSTEGEKGSYGDVVVFELTLNVNPDSKDFQDFTFDLYKGIDQANNPNGAQPVEGNTELTFNVIGHDDDGDAVHTAINIQVNDDVPHFKITYDNEGACAPDTIGHIDEDFLTGGQGNAGGVTSPGNQDTGPDGKSDAGQYGDDSGGTHLHGHISLDFGGDGPADTDPKTIGLNYNGLAYTAGDDFKNVDGSEVSSHGNPLTVLEFDGENLVVGYHNTTTDENVTVFTLDFNPNTGNFDFCLEQPLDQPFDPSSPETNLLLTFSVGSATDADGDTSQAVIQILVNDDHPEIYTTYDNQTPGGDDSCSYGEDGGTPSFAPDLVTIGGSTTTDYGHVDEDWLAVGNQDDDGTHGTTTVTGTLDFKYGADGPGTAAADTDTPTISLASYTVSTTDPFVDANGNSFTSHGQDLYVLTADATDLVVGTKDGTPIFEVHLTGEDFTFTLDGPLDHGAPGSSTDTDLPVSIGVTSAATDFDGDKATDSAINIMVHDDTPEAVTQYENQDYVSGSLVTTESNTLGYIDEDWLSVAANGALFNGNQDKDGQNINGDTPGTYELNGNVIGAGYGADGPGNTSPGFSNVTEGQQVYGTNGDGNSVALETVDGLNVYLHINMSKPGQEILVGFTNSDNSSDFVSGQSSTVFLLDLTTDGAAAGNGTPTGYFGFTLEKALQDGNADDSTQEGTLLLSFDGSQTDFDGDPVLGMIKIQINDDKPVITAINNDTAGYVSESALVTSNSHSTAITGEVVASFGADGPAAHNPYTFANSTVTVIDTSPPFNSVTLTSGGQTVHYDLSSDGTTITGYIGSHSHMTDVFTMKLDSSGHWTFTLMQPVDNPLDGNSGDSLNLGFAVQVTDGDGSTATTVMGVNIVDDKPVANEDDDTASKYSGNVLTNDYVGADGATVTHVSGANSVDVDQHGGGTKVLGADGFLTIHDDGTWTYTQTNPTKDTTDTFTYTITDGDGETSQANLVITLRKPPVANPDNIYTNYTGVITLPDSVLTANDLPTNSGDILAVTAAAAASGQSGFFDQAPSHSNSHQDVSFELDTVHHKNDSTFLQNGDTTSFTYTLQDTTSNASDTGGLGVIHYSTSDTIDRSSDTANDIIVGGDSTSMKGGSGDDYLFSYSSASHGVTEHGGAGNDTLTGGAGHDHLYGDAGSDILIFGSGDTFNGGDGTANDPNVATDFDTVKFTSDASVSGSDLSSDFRNIDMLDLGHGGSSDNVSIGSSSHGITPGQVLAATTVVGGIASLYIEGDSGDNVYVHTSGGGAAFSANGSVTNPGGGVPAGTYDEYTATGQGAAHNVTVNVYVENTVHEHTGT